MKRSESVRSLLVPRKKRRGHSCALAFLITLELLSFRSAAGQTPSGTAVSDVLHQMNNSVEQLIRRVSPTIVQIQVTGYGATDDNERSMTSAIIGRRRAVGSGVIVDPEGYIVGDPGGSATRRNGVCVRKSRRFTEHSDHGGGERHCAPAGSG
jgi:hypothetical protein